MKKIVSIVAVAAMVSAMFAGEPAVNVAVTEFNGNASVTWGIDLDRGTTGFKNAASGSLKVNFVDEGDKATESDKAVWGEIKVKTDGMKAENGGLSSAAATVDYAKLHIGPAWVGITSGDTQVGGYKPVLATDSDNANTYNVAAVGVDASQGIEIGYKMDKMFSAALNFRSVKAAPMKPATDKYWNGGNADYYSDQYALSLDVTFDMVENLGVAAGVARNITVGKEIADVKDTDWALFGKVDYKLALGDSKFYVKPGVAATWTQKKTEKTIPVLLTKYDEWSANTNVVAGVLFGWGAENQDTNIKYIPKKVSDGVSVALLMDSVNTSIYFDKDNYYKGNALSGKMVIGAWDSATLVPNLTFGAEARVNNLFSKAFSESGKEGGKDAEFKKDEALKEVDNTVYVSSLIAEAKYAIDLDGKTITPKVAAKFGAAEVKDEDAAKKLAETGDKTWKLYATGFYFGVDFAGFVPFTTFSVDYETVDATVDYMYKGHLDFTCKISF